MILIVYFLPQGIVPALRALRLRGGLLMLEVRNLSVGFGGLLALDGVSFEVREGEVLSLIGPNGAGKTTAFNAVSGYLAPSGGEIVFRGQDLGGLKPSRIAALGLVRTFQKTSLFGNRSALENVLTGLHLKAKQTPLAIMLGCRTSPARRRR
jgi:branched-chain amino acid transport system ATP-binding protein